MLISSLRPIRILITHSTKSCILILLLTITVFLLVIDYLEELYINKHTDRTSTELVELDSTASTDVKLLKESSSPSTLERTASGKAVTQLASLESIYNIWRARRRNETSHVDCGRVLNEDKDYVKLIVGKRPKLIPQVLDMNCSTIRGRLNPINLLKPLAFGVAHVRIVYESYQFVEDELISSYHPQNFFCYSVDKKSPAKFFNDINNLAECLPNVLISKQRFDITHGGKFMNHAFYSCLKSLISHSGWEYAILLQVNLSRVKM
ncbi:Core-2/I-Branching enzyme [Dictyocaulus viviparus]|uniref:Core-2/I-Branching enzyme n=1 Tax=Dictyocaulus viviparus TaxID=29172 RepID=A0A0D8XHU6_DICVI|nr:Core-2/I-Branching enzyme [Dictyocaulus viviparus]